MEEEKSKKNKGGRPPKKLKRESNLGFFVTVPEKELIKSKAARTGVKVADYLRDIALKGKVRNLATPEEIQQYRELTGIANNINQLTKEAHKQNFAFIVPKLLKSLDELHKTLENIDNKNKNR